MFRSIEYIFNRYIGYVLIKSDRRERRWDRATGHVSVMTGIVDALYIHRIGAVYCQCQRHRILATLSSDLDTRNCDHLGNIDACLQSLQPT